MEKTEFKKIFEKTSSIIDAGIEEGYFQEDKKEELNRKLLAILNNGVECDIPGTAVYGEYRPSQKKLYYNAKVFKTDQEALIYILHEMKHGLDHFPKSIGFQKNNRNVGMNEGATQRFATDIGEKLIGEKIPETVQTSLGISLQTNLDEYQIEDRLNELLCKALGISKSDFLKAQNEESQQAFGNIVKRFDEYASFYEFQQALDEIYEIQEETWFDEGGNLLEVEAQPTEDQTQRAKESIARCQNQIYQYIQKSDSSKLPEIESEFIIPLDQCMEIIETNDVAENSEPMNDKEVLYQADYMKYQEFLLNGVDLGDNTIVFITGLSAMPFEEIFEGEQSVREKLDVQNEQLGAIMYVRSGDTYKVAGIDFDKNGATRVSDYKEIDSLDNIIEHIEHSEVIGNADEYIRILNLQGRKEKAQKVQKKYDYYLENIDRIDEIRCNSRKRLAESRELMEMFSDIEISTSCYNSYDFGISEEDGDYYVDIYGDIHFTEDSIKEVAEDARSIDARKKTQTDLKQAQINEEEHSHRKEQGEE